MCRKRRKEKKEVDTGQQYLFYAWAFITRSRRSLDVESGDSLAEAGM